MCVCTSVHIYTFGEGKLNCHLIFHLPVTEMPSRHWVCSNLSTTSGQALREGFSVWEFNTAQLSFSWCSLGWKDKTRLITESSEILFLNNARWASQVALVVKNLPDNAGDLSDVGSIPGLGRCPGGGHGTPLQYSSLENAMDRGAWWATVHGVTEGQTRLKCLSTLTQCQVNSEETASVNILLCVHSLSPWFFSWVKPISLSS